MTMTIGMTLDCVDVASVAAFWKEALGYDEPQPLTDAAPFHALVAPDGGLHHLTFQRVSEPKQGKNRAHLDLFVDSLDNEVARLSKIGGQIVEEHDEEGGYRTTIMVDPEGNEFCVVQHQ